MARLINSPDELYQKHKKLIYKLIHKYRKDGYADFEDLESLSNEIFAKCFRKWDPSKGTSFSTYFHRALENAFITELKKSECRLRNEGEAAMLLSETEEMSGAEWLMGFLQFLDKDAKQIVAKLFRQETIPSEKLMSKKDTKEILMNVILKKPDWPKARVKRAFKSIKVALQV